MNQVIANLQNLAKHGLVSPKDGFNSFLKDIHAELISRCALPLPLPLPFPPSLN